MLPHWQLQISQHLWNFFPFSSFYLNPGEVNLVDYTKWKWNNYRTGTFSFFFLLASGCWLDSYWSCDFPFTSAWGGIAPTQTIIPETVSISLWRKVGLLTPASALTLTTLTVSTTHKALSIIYNVINKYQCYDGVCPVRNMCWKLVAINTGYHVARVLALLSCDRHCCRGWPLFFQQLFVFAKWKFGFLCRLLVLIWPAQTSGIFDNQIFSLIEALNELSRQRQEVFLNN